jgi:hypothetical protein
MLLNKEGTTLVAYPSATGAITLSVTAIGDYAFNHTNITSVTASSAVSVGEYAFVLCASLASVSLPATASIGFCAFQSCTSLTSVSLPAAASIGEYAFQECTSLASVSLPASLTTIHGGAFYGCTALTSITVDSGNTQYSANGGMLLNKEGTTLIAYPSATGAITLSVTAIGSGAFSGTNITSVTASSVTSISSESFIDCRSLASVSLPAIASIGDDAFAGCTSLVSVSLPATPPSLGSTVFRYTELYSGSSTITITVPSGKAADYTSAWGVSATTAAGGDTSKYGSDHTAISIVEEST